MKSDLSPDITPESRPDHHVVGHDFMGHSCKHEKAARWFCKSHDASGYNMVNRSDPDDETNVSEQVIGRTFHAIADLGWGERSRWGMTTIGKDGKTKPEAPNSPHVTIDKLRVSRIFYGW